MFEPSNLKLWSHPDNYMGEVWPGYYVFLSQHRDSDSLTRSNFIRGLELIGGESDTVHVIREGHWAVGWVEWIAIHQDDEKALQLAYEIAAGLSDYPIIDESHFSELEWNEAQDYWASMSIRERVALCSDADVSIFAARRDWIPEDDTGYIYERLTRC